MSTSGPSPVTEADVKCYDGFIKADIHFVVRDSEQYDSE